MRNILLAAALAASLAAVAQPGPGGGPGRGPGGCPGGLYGTPAAGGAAPCWNADTVPGWGMMSAGERQAHQDRMRGMKSRAECQAYMDSHHQQMQARAKERGQSMPGPGPQGRGCAYLPQ